MRNNIGRGLIELIFSITIIFILYAVFARHWIVNLEEARKVTMKNELTNLRYSLQLYRMFEGRYPEDLRQLNTSRVSIIKEDSLYGRRYLELQSQDEQGYPVDPYGRRFIYNNKLGTIKVRRR